MQPILGDSSAGLKWITGAQKTYDEAWQQWSDECGGGIFWVSLNSFQCRASTDIEVDAVKG